MWSYDGVWHRLDTGTYSIAVLESSRPLFDLATDVEVASARGRWSATFVTPEQIRECLDRWVTTGEALPGNYFGVPDAFVVAELTLESIRAVVAEHFDPKDDSMRQPFAYLNEPDT